VFQNCKLSVTKKIPEQELKLLNTFKISLTSAEFFVGKNGQNGHLRCD
jgi:hypothetical protein